tara:strand:+ start:274 stop:867 length:594 start_codon:yes stop_codon:yes gene_type:complete
MQDKTTIESYLPIFTGFYNTFFQYHDEDQEIDYYNQENGTNYDYDNFTFDYAEHNERVAKTCTVEIEKQIQDLGIKIEYQKIHSPKYYNFGNDSINVKYTIESDTMSKIINTLKENTEKFDEYLERYRSRDGFSSFYSVDADIWINEYLTLDSDKITHCFGSALDFILSTQDFNEMDLYESIYDEKYISFELDKETI